MRLNLTPAFHSWTQTISIIASTGLSVIALWFGLQAHREIQISAQETNVQAMWHSYNESVQEFYESRMDGGDEFEEDALSLNLFWNSLLILDGIDAQTNDLKWEKRIGFETLRHHRFICQRMISEPEIRSVFTGTFQQRMLNKLENCSAGRAE